jgi:hypothetical protein
LVVFTIEPFNGSRTNGNVLSKKHRKKEKRKKDLHKEGNKEKKELN